MNKILITIIICVELVIAAFAQNGISGGGGGGSIRGGNGGSGSGGTNNSTISAGTGITVTQLGTTNVVSIDGTIVTNGRSITSLGTVNLIGGGTIKSVSGTPDISNGAGGTVFISGSPGDHNGNAIAGTYTDSAGTLPLATDILVNGLSSIGSHNGSNLTNLPTVQNIITNTAATATSHAQLVDSLGVIGTGSFPSDSNAKITQYNSFVAIPNTDSVYTFIPGTYSKFNGNWGLINDGTIAGDSLGIISFFTDSIGNSFGLSGNSQGFPSKVSYGNKCVFNGVQANGAVAPTFGQYHAQTLGTLNVFEVGINDMRTYGTLGLNDYIGIMESYLLSEGTLSVGQSQGIPASWATADWFFASSVAMATTNNSAPAVFTNICGTAVYINYEKGWLSNCTFTVAIDGIIVATNTTASAYTNQIHPFALDYPISATTNHTVIITKIDGISSLKLGYVYGNYKRNFNALINVTPKNYVLSIPYMRATTNAATGYIFYGGSATLTDQYNSALVQMINRIGAQGQPACFVDLSLAYQPNNSGFVQADDLHPTAVAHTQIANLLYRYLRFGIMPEERSALRYLMYVNSLGANQIRYATTNLTAAITATVQFSPAFNDTNYGVTFCAGSVAVATPLVTGKTTNSVTTSMGAFTGTLELGLIHQ